MIPYLNDTKDKELLSRGINRLPTSIDYLIDNE